MSWVYSSASAAPGSGIPRAGEPGLFILRRYAVLANRPPSSPTIQYTTAVVRSVIRITASPPLESGAAARVGIAFPVYRGAGES